MKLISPTKITAEEYKELREGIFEPLRKKNWKDFEIYEIINKEPREYANLLKDIKTQADSNKNLSHKKMCKLLMRYLKRQWNEVERLNNIIKEVREYITSYESISTIQGLGDIEANKDLDEKTLNEMVRRYMIVHDKLLEILDKADKGE